MDDISLTYTEKKAFLVAYKGGKCTDCGNSYPQVCMQFDHRDVNTKRYSISEKMRLPFEELKEELDKCDLVCANCHAIRTSNNEELRKKQAESARRVARTPEWKKAVSLGKTGLKRRPFSDQWRKNLSEAVRGNTNARANKGKPWSESRRIAFLAKQLQGEQNA